MTASERLEIIHGLALVGPGFEREYIDNIIRSICQGAKIDKKCAAIQAAKKANEKFNKYPF